MATETIIKVTCDICKNEMSSISHNNRSLSVIFTTEQTEGRSIKPYISTEKLDWCKKCEENILKGNMVFAQGAQGYNIYYFERNENIS